MEAERKQKGVLSDEQFLKDYQQMVARNFELNI